MDGIDTRPTSLTIVGQAADGAQTFVNSIGDISSRAKTAASVNWSPAGWTSIGAVDQTPDLSAIIQEIVNRPGWVSGNSLVLITTKDTGKREAASFEANSAQAPLLHIEY